MNMRILLVDDDAAIRKLCTVALMRLGHEVIPCRNGREALGQLHEGFDLALCDIGLPDIHGIDVIRALKSRAPGLPVIVISALDPNEWGKKASEAGADHFMAKPLRLSALRDEVAMAARAQSHLMVCLQDPDEAHREALCDALVKSGSHVRVVDSPADAMDGTTPELLIVDAASTGVESVVRWAGAHGIHCFVLVESPRSYDDRLLRMGASLILQKPVDPAALLLQAGFLGAR